jgi:hypothetical protein
MSEQQTALPLDCPPVSPSKQAPAAAAPGDGVWAQVPGLSHWGSTSPIEALKWMFSFPSMLGVVLVGLVFYEARVFHADPDTWWHIKVGQDILRTHHWPTVDPYSFTAANTPWIAYEWLGEVALAGVSKLGGIYGLAVFRFALAALVVLALYYLGTVRSKNCKAGFVPAGVLASLVLLSFTLRPQMFGYVFLVLLLIVLKLFRKGVSWPVWTLPAMFLLWVNTHGSFIVGIGVLAVYLCCGLKSFQVGSVQAIAWSAKQRIQLELALLLSLAVLPITPYGTQLAVYPFDIMFNQPVNLASILEWRPMPFEQVIGRGFLAIVVLLVVLQLLFRFVWRMEELLLAVGGTVMAFVHVRMILLFVPFVVPVFATVAARWFPRYAKAKDKPVLNGLIMASVVAAMTYYIPTHSSVQNQVASTFPVEAVAYLDSHDVPGPMFNNYGFGGYMVGHGSKTFIDGRADIFERSGVLADYLIAIQLKPGALAVLDRYRIQSCLLLKDEPLAIVLGSLPEWKRVHSDGTAALFVRQVGRGLSSSGNR